MVDQEGEDWRMEEVCFGAIKRLDEAGLPT